MRLFSAYAYFLKAIQLTKVVYKSLVLPNNWTKLQQFALDLALIK